jgi:putative hydrolase of the HAD superfamily
MHNLQDIQVIVFDLDDTLFPEHEFVLSGLKAVGNWMLEQYAVTDFFNVAWNLFQTGQRGTIFNQTLDYLNVEYSSDLIQDLVQVYRDHQPSITLHPDARWAIEHFKPHKQLGLITNGFLKTQQNKVQALAIGSCFDALIYCDVYGRESWKPSPLPYQKLMETTKLHGANHLYVGDHPNKDFVAAKQLGWMTLRICRQDGEHTAVPATAETDAHCKIESLYELAALT